MQLLAGEYITRGQPVYIKDGYVYVLRVDDCVVDCDHFDCDADEEMQCSWFECCCLLDLPNRKYCTHYKPKK